MKDNYPTRKELEGSFIKRSEPVSLEISGLQPYISEGYVLYKSFFNKKNIENITNYKATGLVTNEPGIEGVRSVTGVHNKEPFKGLSLNNSLLYLVKRILGNNIYMHQSRINYKSGLGSNGWHWHSDFETWHAQDGMSKMNCLTAMIPLSENTVCNGPLMVIPKSHELFYSCKKEKEVDAQSNFADQKEGVPDSYAIKEFFNHSKNRVEAIICSPGDLVLFDCNIIHGSVQNMTPLPRTNLFFVYNSIDNKLVQPFSSTKQRPEEMAARANIEKL